MRKTNEQPFVRISSNKKTSGDAAARLGAKLIRGAIKERGCTNM